MSDARRLTEITETLEDIQAALDTIVEHLGLGQHVRVAVGARRAKAERSRLEIERSLGQIEGQDDARR